MRLPAVDFNASIESLDVPGRSPFPRPSRVLRLRILLLVALAALGCANAAEGPPARPGQKATPLARFELVSPAPPETAAVLDEVLRVEASADALDREDEERMLRRLRSDTVEVLATEGYFSAEVSSSMVKGLIGPKGWRKVVRPYVPDAVYRRLLKSQA